MLLLVHIQELNFASIATYFLLNALMTHQSDLAIHFFGLGIINFNCIGSSIKLGWLPPGVF